jgi:hypothetical protein
MSYNIISNKERNKFIKEKLKVEFSQGYKFSVTTSRSGWTDIAVTMKDPNNKFNFATLQAIENYVLEITEGTDYEILKYSTDEGDIDVRLSVYSK